MKILLYTVKIDSPNPTYGVTETVKRYGSDKEAAIRWANINGRHFGPKSDLVYVEEAEYVSEENFKKDIPLYKRHIWSAAFHGYTELNVDFSTEELNAALVNLSILSSVHNKWTWGQIAEFLHYMSIERVKSILIHLRENEYIDFRESGQWVKEISILKAKIGT